MESKKNSTNKYKDLSGFKPWLWRKTREYAELNRPISSWIEKKQKEYRELKEDVIYRQKWPEYNQAQTREKILFYKLLDELLNVVPKRAYTFGRPRKSLRDMIFCCLIKIYSNTSSRRIISELELAHKAGYIKEVPHFNTVLNYFEDNGMSMVLDYLIKVSALPLKSVEDKFAIDSTGFGSKRFDRWFNTKYGEDSNIYKYRKAHVMCGTITQIVTSAIITRANVSDSKMFEPLMKDSCGVFNIQSICADKAYSSRANVELAKKLGTQAYIPFKKNATGKSKGSPSWAKLYRLFAGNYYNFAQEYHQRSNIESCFAMIKRKFGDFCRCKTEQSQNNEILCKILTHNIVVLIHEIFNRGLEPDFLDSSEKLPAQKVV